MPLLLANHIRSYGFSLVELLIVLVLLVGAYALVPPLFSKGIESVEFKQSVRELASALRVARTQAIVKNREMVFILDVENRSYTLGDSRLEKHLHGELDLKLRTAESERLSPQRGGIRFFPNGSSTGGQITASNSHQMNRVAVEWLTGKIKIVD